MAEILVLAAHPQLQHSRITRHLMRALRTLATGATTGATTQPPSRIELRDLYARYPDYLIDVAAEQQALAAARLVVWLHPVYWYSMPPLMKLWLDEVFAFGWAYGPGGVALCGKDLWLVASTGGPASSYHPTSYNRYFFDAFLPPYEQTAALTGLRWLPPLLLHGTQTVTELELTQHSDTFVQRLMSWPDWPEIAALPATLPCTVPGDARPAARS